MLLLWSVLALLLLLALLFLCWPWLRYRHQVASGAALLTQAQVDERLAENVRLFREHMAELETQKADGRIDEAQFNQLKLEQERALLEDEQALVRIQAKPQGNKSSWVFGGLAAVLILVALIAYDQLGNREDVRIQGLEQAKQQQIKEAMRTGRAADPAVTRDLVKALESRLVSEPENIQYWFILARNHMELNEFGKAAEAYKQVLARDKQSGMVLAETAQAIFLRDGNKVSDDVADLTREALVLEPDNSMALGLAGIVAFNRNDYLDAIRHWQRAVKIMGMESAGALSLEAGIDRARTMHLQKGGDAALLEETMTGKQISFSVVLGNGVQLSPDQWVYVYVRAWQGPKMPLAITRIKASDLPRQVTLTEAMSMTPSATLTSFPQLELVARVSQDGSATAKPGDWQGTLGPVELKSLPSNLEVRIDHQVAQ